jgi:glycosyltransferase involved in cell wall biosynthesis
MTILLLTHSYPDADIKWRGLFIQEQAIALSVRHEVIVVYFKTDYSHFGPFSKYSFIKKQNRRITEYELTTCRSFPVINQVKYLRDTYRFIRKEILNQLKIDIVHSHLSYPAGLLGTIIQNRDRIPNVLTEHSWINKYFRSWIHKKCVLYALKNSSCVVAVSQALKDDINLYCKRAVSVIPNVIEVEKFSLSDSAKDNKLDIGILGGMGNYRKGLDILLKAVSLLKDLDLTVHIGGDGKYLGTFKEMAEELGVAGKCIFYGGIKPEKVQDFYSKLDIYVLPSRDETFGVVVVEAMACGLPVIATKCGGPQEIITKETGLLIEKENPQELAQAVRFVSENLGSYNRKAIRKYAVEKYSPETFVESLSGVYQDILQKGENQ